MPPNFDGIDRAAINGKLPRPERTVQVLIIGAGSAGTAAAIREAKLGAEVLLVDENPVSASLMGLDTPLYFGGRMTTAVQRQERMIEQIFASNPALEEALELGVDVALATYAWGAFVNGSGLAAMPQPVVGLANEERAWLVGFDKLILATGARDIPMAFPGWDQPGVMGAGGFAALVDRYNAFAGQRVVVLGSGELGLKTASLARAKGLEVVAIVEALPQAQAMVGSDLADIPLLTGQVIHSAQGGLNGVERISVGPVGGPITDLACDTVVISIGMAPAIELLNAAGGGLTLDSQRGGHVPILTGEGATTLPNVFVTGDCGGLGTAQDSQSYQMAWMRALLGIGDGQVIVCQCEEVTRSDLLGVQPPNYLQRPEKLAGRDVHTLLADGPINQDQIKRLTRACMGACQARRCREQVALTLACATQSAPIPLAGFRAPVRPLPLKVLADWDEAAAMTAGWDVWFGIPSQWVPYVDIGTEREAAQMVTFSEDPA